MRKIIFITVIICLLLNSRELFPQVDSLLASKFLVDFAVPDEPAFKLLNVNQSNILRPATARDFTAAFSSFLNSGKLSIPANFGVEFSPGLLINGNNLTIAQYQQQQAWYRLRVSAATGSNPDLNSGRTFSLGIRTSIIDESDLRTNDTFLSQQASITRKINNIKVTLRTLQGPDGNIVIDDTSQAVIDSLQKGLTDLINKVKDSYSNENWNSRFLDIAAGTYGTTEDSTGKNFSIKDISIWVTYAEGFSTKWLQLLVGLKTSNSLDSLLNKKLFNGSLAARVYMGSNKFKFFVEAQGSAKEKYLPQWLLNSGTEANIVKGIWLEFNGGLIFIAGIKPSLVTDFNVKMSVADLFK